MAIKEVATPQGSVFHRIISLVEDAPKEPKPELIDFMTHNRLQLMNVKDGKINVIGLMSVEDTLKIIPKLISSEDIEMVEKWLKDHPETDENPQFHWNMKNLTRIKNKIQS